MKHLFNTLIVLIVLVIAAAIFLPSLIPASAYRDRVQVAASETLNRDVQLEGDLSFSILPGLMIRATDVRIANAEGFGSDDFAEMSEMRVGVELLPLLSSRVEITEFVLVEPKIWLAQRGRINNWTFAAASESADSATVGSTGFRQGAGALPIEASFGDVRIEDASISFSDGSATHLIDGLDMQVSLPSVDAPTRITGALNANGEALTFDATLGSLREFFEGRETALNLSLGGRLVTTRFDGVIPEGEDLSFDGAFETQIPALRALASFAGAELPPGDQFRNFSTVGRLSGNASRLRLTATSIALDEIRGSGALIVDLNRARPRLRGSLDLPSLDVTPYLPTATEASNTDQTALAAWSEERLDLAGLDVLDVDLTVTTHAFTYGDIEATGSGSGSDAAPITLEAKLRNARLETTLTNLHLYGGSGTARVVANNRSRTPSFSLNADLDGLDALPFLQAAAGFDRLEGSGGMSISLLTSGASQAEIMRSLSGNGRFGFADGAIVGLNIAETIRNVNSFLGNQNNTGSSDDEDQASTGDNASTDFTELGGSFTIASGRATNLDLLMLSPLLRVEGTGWADLPSQSLDYRLRPRAVASIQGQGGNRDLQGVVVPIRIQGRFDDVSYGVDTAAVGQALLSGALSNALGRDSDTSADPEDMLRDGLLDALGLGQNREEPTQDTEAPDAEADAEEDEEIDPAELLLRSLLERGNR
jgi:AsmA protein